MKCLTGLALSLLSLTAAAQDANFRPLGGKLQQLAEITGSQPLALTSSNVAISGNTLVIGAPVANSPNGCFECGIAYVYTAVNGDWGNLQLTATLTQSSGQGSAGFGDSVAVDGDTIIVGGYDFSALSGAAYVYVGPSGTVTESAELTTSGDPSGTFNSVAVDGGTIVAGSPLASAGRATELGAAYVYVEPADGWANMTQTAQLAANSETVGCGFGTSVGISGNTVVVGSPRSKVGSLAGGRAYVFVEPNGGWKGLSGQRAELEPSDGVRQAGFGASVSISGSTVGVGAPGQGVSSAPGRGAAYVFVEPSGGWPKTLTESAELTPGSGSAGAQMGASVAMSGATLVAGAPELRGGQGVVYLFAKPSGGWQNSSHGQPLSAADGAPSNNFGHSVALAQDVVSVTAVGWPDGGLSPDGAAYVFGPPEDARPR